MKKTWLIGGLIFSILALIGIIYFYLSPNLNGNEYSGFDQIYYLLIYFPIALLFSFLFANLGEIGYTIALLLQIPLYFLLGALFGLIYNKIKSKKVSILFITIILLFIVFIVFFPRYYFEFLDTFFSIE